MIEIDLKFVYKWVHAIFDYREFKDVEGSYSSD